MTLIASGYTVSGPVVASQGILTQDNLALLTESNQPLVTQVPIAVQNLPLNHARILWDFKPGVATGDGTGADLAANDYTAQRWQTTGAGAWVFTFASKQNVDTFFIAGHNLAGKEITIETSPIASGAFNLRATFTPADNTPIFVMVNKSNGQPLEVRRYRVSVPSASAVAIIRAGKALQMQQPFYGGHNPALWNRVTEGQQSFSETGQWLGRTQKRLAYANSYEWMHVPATWYRDNFEPFAQTLPLKPFAIAGNPQAMPYDVAWAWASGDVSPQNMGLRNFVTFGMQVTGYAG